MAIGLVSFCSAASKPENENIPGQIQQKYCELPSIAIILDVANIILDIPLQHLTTRG